ncbi:glycosyltransferase family 4 protein [Streptomyces sp. NPDC059003]|uniref:glycosyltransferase family 4 protein n=1 Tax=Streptomyces sp. NPDC059003 TaxID=3346691 RepID=UPI0036BFBE64
MAVVYFVVPAGWDDEHRPSGGNRYDRELARELGHLGWDVRPRPVAGSWPRPGGEALRELSLVLETLPDGSVVLLDGLIAGAVPDLMAAHHGRQRLVVLVHLPLADESGLDTRTARDLARGERTALGYASAAVATSRWTAARLTKRHGLPGVRVHVAVPGVRLAPLAPGTPSGGRHLLCVASATHRKGLPTLVRALAALPRDLPWRLKVAGAEPDPAYAARLRALIDKAGLSGRVCLLGPLPSAALEAEYAWADLLVLASGIEPYGMCVTEALAHGLPVYASDTGGIPEAMGHAVFPGGSRPERPGRLIAPGDIAAWADALGEWMRELLLRDRLRTLAEQRQRTLPAWRSTALEVHSALQGHASTRWHEEHQQDTAGGGRFGGFAGAAPGVSPAAPHGSASPAQDTGHRPSAGRDTRQPVPAQIPSGGNSLRPPWGSAAGGADTARMPITDICQAIAAVLHPELAYTATTQPPSPGPQDPPAGPQAPAADPAPAPDGSPGEAYAALRAEQLQQWQQVVGELRQIRAWGEDPLLHALETAHRRRTQLEEDIRLLITLGREFVSPRPYDVSALARAAGMTQYLAKKAYGAEEIACIRQVTGLDPRSPAADGEKATPSARCDT